MVSPRYKNKSDPFSNLSMDIRRGIFKIPYQKRQQPAGPFFQVNLVLSKLLPHHSLFPLDAIDDHQAKEDHRHKGQDQVGCRQTPANIVHQITGIDGILNPAVGTGGDQLVFLLRNNKEAITLSQAVMSQPSQVDSRRHSDHTQPAQTIRIIQQVGKRKSTLEENIFSTKN